MKILHVSHGYLPESAGGVEIYLRDVMPAQRAAGHDVKLLTGSLVAWEKAGLEETEVEGIPVYRLHRQDWFFDHYARHYSPDAERMIVEVLAREQPDVVHVHQWIRLTSNIVELCEAEGIPTVVTLHDVYTSCPRAFRVHRDGNPCERELSTENCVECVPRFGHESDDEVAEGVRLYAESYASELGRAHKVLVALDTTAQLLSKTTGTPHDRYHAVGMGYRPRFHGLQLAKNDDDTFRFAYWGNLNVQKGSHVLAAAFRDVVDQVPGPVELHMFGSPSDQEFDDMLRNLSKGLPVTFHGRYDAPDLLQVAIDAAVFPALCFETFSLSLTECFELGLPSIVADIGSLADRAGGASVHVPPGDRQALTAAMVRLATDAEHRDWLKGAIPPLPPTPDRHGETLVEVYEQALAATAPAGIKGPTTERRLAFLEQMRSSAAAAGREPFDPAPPA